MELAKLTPNISVTGQLTEDDLAEATAAGFRSIINNRPDSGVERLGLACWHISVVSGRMSAHRVAAFRATLSEAEKPALALCRTRRPPRDRARPRPDDRLRQGNSVAR